MCTLKGDEIVRQLNVCFDCFHEDCLKEYMDKSPKPECPLCKRVYENVIGIQPNGIMNHYIVNKPLPGYEKYDTIVITYNFNSGSTTDGSYYNSFMKKAYLPDNDKGKKVLELLEKAFDNRKTFCVVRDSNYSAKIEWNGIHHKTSINGGLYIINII